MDRLRRESVWPVLMFGLMGVVPSRASACAFDGIFDGSIGYLHPRSVEVALAVRQAVADGALPEQALAPGMLNGAGLWRATEQLNQLGAGCRPSAPGRRRSVRISPRFYRNRRSGRATFAGSKVSHRCPCCRPIAGRYRGRQRSCRSEGPKWRLFEYRGRAEAIARCHRRDRTRGGLHCNPPDGRLLQRDRVNHYGGRDKPHGDISKSDWTHCISPA